jgi:serine/threonine protein kinase
MTSSSSSSLLILSGNDHEVARVPVSAVDAELYSATSVRTSLACRARLGSAMSVVSAANPASEPKLQLSELPDESTPAQSRTEEWDIPYEELVLERELGRGAFGVVYRGTWRLQEVAVKQLLGSTDKRGKRYRELLAECRLMMALRPHRNVVQLLGVSANVGKPLCIVTAIADRGSLRDLLDDKRQQLVWPLVLRMLVGIGAGVHHLHLEKVLHRDLAARNVLLTAALEPQITDFGLSAKVLDPDDYKQAEFFRGPYKHMAPESLRDNEFSKKSDAWMFGVVAWELMTRREPHPDMDIYEAAKLIRKGATPAPLSKLPRALKTLLEGCWLYDPLARTDIEQSVMSLKAVKLSDTESWHPWPLQIKPNVSPAVNALATSGGADAGQTQI